MTRIIVVTLLFMCIGTTQAIVDEPPELRLANAVRAFSNAVIDFTMDGKDVVITPRPVDIAPFAGNTFAFQMYGSKDTSSCKNDFYAMTYHCDLKKGYIRYTKSKLTEGNTVYSEEIIASMGVYGSMYNEVVGLAIDLITLQYGLENDSFRFDRIGKLTWDADKSKLKIDCPYTTPETEQAKKCQGVEYDLDELMEPYDEYGNEST